MASEAVVLQVLELFTTLYPNHPLTSPAIGVYVRLLGDIPDEVLSQAALDLLSRSTYFPTIAELRSSAMDLQEAFAPLPHEYLAWAEVQDQIRAQGHEGEPAFSHPLVSKAVEILGWRYLCLSEDIVADRAHFFQAYKALAQDFRKDRRQPAEVKAFLAAARNQLPMGKAEGEHVQ